MKKLLLLISLLLATNAWGEMKILNCEVKVDDADDHSVRINFDLDLPVAEISITNANGIYITTHYKIDLYR